MSKDKPHGGTAKQVTMERYTGSSVQSNDQGGAQGGTPDNTALLAAITQCQTTLKSKIGEMGSEVLLLRQDL